MKKYAIRLDNEPVWFCDGDEEVFDTEAQAIEAMIQENAECRAAVRAGFMADWGGFDEYRIVEVFR